MTAMPDQTSPSFTIRPLTVEDRAWVAQFAGDHWGSDLMIVNRESFYLSRLPGFLAELENQPAGLITYNIVGSECEIISLDSLHSGKGIGTALIERVKSLAAQLGCQKLRVTTTNDNIEALLFYQKRGFSLYELRPGAVNESRMMKPQIPPLGNHGLPIRDEIELELDLSRTITDML